MLDRFLRNPNPQYGMALTTAQQAANLPTGSLQAMPGGGILQLLLRGIGMGSEAAGNARYLNLTLGSLRR